MNEINFLPTTFAAGQKRMHRIYREVTWVAVTMMVILGWWATSRDGLADLRAYAQAVQNEADAAKERKLERVKLENRQAVLAKQVKIQRELSPPLKTTQAMATVAKVMPPKVSLRSLTLVTRRPAPAVSPKETGKPAARARPARKPEKAAATDPMTIELIGLAPTDGDIAEFVGQLSNHPLFTGVKLVFSREATVGDLIAREFRIELEVPLDREYRPAATVAGAEEVSDED